MTLVSHFAETDTARVKVAHVCALAATTETATDDTALELWGARSACKY